MTQQSTGPRGELVKFGIVVLIAVVVVVAVALSRPFIFGRVVPAVLGEGQPAAPVTDEPAPDNAYPAAEEEEDDAAAEDAEDTEGVGGEPETAVPATEEDDDAETITHVVQPGETLFAIARIYDVTVEQLVAANDISDPNVVPVGTELTIPQREN